MKSILEVSKEGITIYQIPLSDRITVGSEEWKKIPDRSISSMNSNIQFRLVNGKNLMVFLLDRNSKVNLKGIDHSGPKTILVPYNERVIVETGHSLKLSTDIKENKRVFSKATIYKQNLPGLKIDGVPVVFNSDDDAVDIIEKQNNKEEEFFDEEIDEIQIEAALNEKVELNKLYYDDEDLIKKEELTPHDPPPTNQLNKTGKQGDKEVVDQIIEISNQGNEAKDFEIDQEDEITDSEKNDEQEFEIEEEQEFEIEEEQEFEMEENHQNLVDVVQENELQSHLEINSEDIIIGEDFSEQVFEDLHKIETQNDLDDKDQDKNNKPDNKNDGINKETVKDEAIDIPDDEEWEKIQAEMNRRLNSNNTPKDSTEEKEETLKSFEFEEKYKNMDQSTEEVNDSEEIEIENKTKSSIKDILTSLFSKNRKQPPSNDFEPDKEQNLSNNHTDKSYEFKKKQEDKTISNFLTSFSDAIKTLTRKNPLKKFKKDPSLNIVFEETKENAVKGELAAPISEDEDINYEELNFERPEVSEVHEPNNSQPAPPSRFQRFTAIAKIKNIFSKKAPDRFDNETDHIEDNKNFEEFRSTVEPTGPNMEIPQDDRKNNEANNIIEKLKYFFKRKTKTKKLEKTKTIGMTNAQIKAEQIASEMENTYSKIKVEKLREEDEYEEDELEDELEDEEEELEDEEDSGKKTKKNKRRFKLKTLKKNKNSLVKNAKKGKKTTGQDPKPGIFARSLSVAITLFIVFNIYHHFKSDQQFIKYIGIVEKKLEKTRAPLEMLIKSIQQQITKQIPKTYHAPLLKIYTPDHLKYLYQKDLQRMFLLYLIFELLSLILIGNSLPLYLMGVRSENNPVSTRLKGVIRLFLWLPITLLLPYLDFGILINRRSFREVITKSYLNYPSTSYRNFIILFVMPLTLLVFFGWPYITNLDVFSAIKISEQTFNPVNESELEYSEVLDISLKPYLQSGYIFIPAWQIGQNQRMQASLKIYSIKTNQLAYMKKHISIDLSKILKQVARYDPLFVYFHPKLEVFLKDKMSDATIDNYQALNNFLLSSLSISIHNTKSLSRLYKTGPYINDDLLFKKLFLKDINQTGVQEIIVHKNKFNKTIEIVPSRQAGNQTSYFLSLNNKENTLYSLTYNKNATDTRREMTNLSLSKISFTHKSSKAITNPAIKSLAYLQNIVDPNYKDEEALKSSLNIITHYQRTQLYLMKKNSLISHLKRSTKQVT